jgi:hypothetical protein
MGGLGKLSQFSGIKHREPDQATTELKSPPSKQEAKVEKKERVAFQKEKLVTKIFSSSLIVKLLVGSIERKLTEKVASTT